MKKMLVVLAAMAFVIVMVGGAYAAPDTTAVPVTATVVSNCAITGGSIAFGTVDAITDAAGKSATVTAPTIYCTMGATVTVTDDQGLYESGTPRMNDGGTGYLAYGVTYDGSLTGAGMNSSIGGATGLNLTADIASGALDDVPAGSYVDTITLTVAY